MPSPQAQKGLDKRGKPLQGLKNGNVTELSMFFNVKPGHEKAIRDAIEEFCTNPSRDPSNPKVEKAFAGIGIHEVRLVLFDNDSRLLWLTSFDTDWDTYIDDTIAFIGVPIYGSILMHTVEAPEGIEKPNLPNASAAVKDIFNSVRITGAGLLVTCANISIKEQFRNRDIRSAFEKVLNNQGAEEALQHQALK